MIDFNGKNVVITGGSKGIGKACVDMFHRANANVIFSYSKDKKSADSILYKYNYKNIHSFQLDSNDETSILNFVKQIENTVSGIDVLVNNAGIWKYAPLDKMGIKQWSETINTNLTGSFLITKYCLPLLKSNKGNVVFISSTAAQRGEANYSHYAASKGAINSFTKSLAAELGPEGIRVNCIAPGWVITDMTKDVFKDEALSKIEIDKIPIKRIAQPEDIAGPVLFLASDFAKQINGEILNVNGGSVLCG